MKVASGTIGEVLPGTGYTSYPNSTNPTGGNHFGYVASLGYFGEYFALGNSLSYRSAQSTDGPLGYNSNDQGAGGVNGSINTTRPAGNSYFLSSVLSDTNYNIYTGLHSVDVSSALYTNLKPDYKLGENVVVSTYDPWSQPSLVDYNLTSNATPSIKNSYSILAGDNNGGYEEGVRVNRRGHSTQPSELKADGSIEDNVSGNTYSPNDCGQSDIYGTTGACGGPATFHTNPAVIKQNGAISTYTSIENNYQITDATRKVFYWSAGSAINDPGRRIVPTLDKNSVYTLGNTTQEQPLIQFDVNGTDILTEPGFYITTGYTKNASSDYYGAASFYQTPITTAAKAKVLDGRRGKGKEWVMIEE
jgi:hypothetical protein